MGYSAGTLWVGTNNVFRLKFLAVLVLGLLVACEPTDDRAPGAEGSLSEARQSLTTRVKTIDWSTTTSTGNCQLCASSGRYASCLAATDSGWTKSFNNVGDDGSALVPDGYLVVEAKAEVYGASVRTTSGSTNVVVTLNALELGNFTNSHRACDTTCETPAALTQTNNAGLSGYVYGGNNSLKLAPTTNRYCASHVVLTLKLAERRIRVSPASLSFGDQKKGTTSTSQTVTVYNDGEAPLRVSSLSTGTGTGSPFAFTVVSPTDPNAVLTAPFDIPAGGSRDVKVTFTPGALGNASGTLTLTSNASNASAGTVALSGNGVTAIEMSPPSLDFGKQKTDANASLLSKKVTVRNTGSANVSISGISIGEGQPFALVNPPSTPYTLTPSTPLELEVTFNPTVGGLASGTLTVTTDEPSTFPISLSGEGVTYAADVSPGPLDFGEQREGASSAPMTVTVRNAGSTSLQIDGASIEQGKPFALVTPPAMPFSLAAGASQTLSVKFNPTTEGAVSGTLTITTQDPAKPSIPITLTGTGVKPYVVLSPSPLAFGNQRVDTTLSESVSVSNALTATSSITVTAVAVSGNGAFSLESAPAVPFTLAAGNSQEVSVRFAPTAEGTVSGTLTFTTNDPVTPSLTVTLGGTGVKPNVTLSPSPLAFGTQRVDASRTETVTVSNASTATSSITITSVAVSGNGAFALGTVATPFTVAAGSSQGVPVKFTPTGEGAVSGTLTLTTNDPVTPTFTVTLSGTGVKPNVTLSPSPLAFGTQRVDASRTETVTVSNASTATSSITVTSVAVSGNAAFALGTVTTPFTVAPGSSQGVPVKFTPTSEGAVSGTLTLTTNDPVTPTFTVTLSGTGVKPNVTLNPSPLAFGTQRVDATRTETVTVSNASTATSSITVLTVTVSGNAAFALGTVTTPFTVAPGSSQGMPVKFTPTGEGTVSGTLTLTTNDPVMPLLTVTLGGTGVKPHVTLSPSPLAFGTQRVDASRTETVTVSNASTATSSITVTAVAVSGNAAFSLDPAPAVPFTLVAGNSQGVPVKFTPTGEGAVSGTLTLTTNDPVTPTLTVTLGGTGVKPNVTLSPNPLAFGTQRVDASRTETVTVSNASTATSSITVTSVAVSGDAAFVLGTVATPFTVAPGSSQGVPVKFTPTSEGAVGGTLTLTTNDPVTPTFTVTLSGTGVKPNVTLSPSPLAFGTQRVDASRTETVTVSNASTATSSITVTSVAVSGNAAFALGIVTTPFTVAPGSSQGVPVKFTPTSEGAVSGTLTLTTNDPVTPTFTVTLSGTGVKPHMVLSPSPLAFGEQWVGTHRTETVTVSNASTATSSITITAVTVSGNVAFTRESAPAVPFTLAEGNSQQVSVKFAPTIEGALGGTLTFTTNDPVTPTLTVTLTGIGVKPNVTLSPSPLAFGTQRVGDSRTETVTVSNAITATSSITVNSVAVSGNAAFTLGTVATPFTLLAGDSQQVPVLFTPTGEGAVSGTLTLTTNDPVTPTLTVSLTGTGVKPNLVLSPNPLAFGEQRVGVTSAAQKVLVSNATGSGPITITSVSVGTGGPFALVTPPAMPLTLAAGGSTELSVTFTPSSEGVVSGILTLTTSDKDFSTATVSLTGTGVKPVLALSPNPLAFGEQRVGVTSAAQKVLVSNATGSGPITITAVSVGTSGPFALVTPPAMPLTLVAGGSTELSVTFTPSTQGAVSGTLTLTTSDKDFSTTTVSLTGTGVKPVLALSPNPLAFGEQRVGVTSAAQKVLVSNATGSGPITITGVSVGNGGPFALVSPPVMPLTLAAGGSAELSVTFTPGTQGAVSGTLTLTTSDKDWPTATVSLSGIGVNPILELLPASLAFGEQRVGTTSTAQKVKVSNKGSGTLKVSSLSITSGAPFSVSPSTGFDLAAGASTELSVTFSPTTEESFTATLTLTTNDPVTPSIVSLSGNGVKPLLEVFPTSLSFGTQIVGTSSAAQKVTVTNRGTGPVRIRGSSITGSTAFNVTPSTAFDLVAGASAELSVTFSPTAKGAVSATLNLSTDETTSSAPAVSLSGTGVSWLEMSPATLLDFGEVPWKTTLKRTVTLTNKSSVPITITSVSSVVAPFSVSGISKDQIIPANSAIAFDVNFSPSTGGQFDGVLTLTSDAANSPHTLILTGTGIVPEGQFSLSTGAVIASLDFKGVQVNGTKELVVRFKNIGKAPFASSSIALTYGNTGFTYMGPASISLAPGAYIDFSVSFRPASTSTYNDTLTIVSNAVNSPMSLSLTGFGANPELKLDRTSIFFGDVRVGSTSDPVPITVNNTGNAEVTVQSLPVEGPFAVVLPSGVSLPRIIPANTSFTFHAVYKPSVQGPESGSVSILSDISNTTTLRVALSGSGTISVISMSVAALDFGNQRVKAVSGVQPVVITNTGKAELHITQFIFSNPVFAISSPLPLPTESAPLKIAAGEQKAISVTFTPSTLGLTEGKLYIVSNAFTPAPALDLKGSGVDGQISLTPSVVSFSGVDVGGAAAQKSVVLKNTGGYTLTITSLTPPPDASFSVSGLPTGLVLQPGDSWSFTVTFAPTKRGYVFTSAIIGSDAVMNPAFSLSLEGTGVAAAVDLQPKNVYFGKSNVGVPTTQDISIKNVGERDLYVSNISFADEGSGASLDFSIGSGVTFPLVVKSGESTLAQLKFTPRAVGERRAKAIVYTNDTAAEANLVGEGTSALLKLTVGSVEVSQLEFGNVLVGNPSSPIILTLTNRGTGPLTLSTMTLGGADAAAFIVTPPSLPLTLQPSASAEVSVSLKPDAERLFTAQLAVGSNDAATPSISVPMSGAGTRQQIQLSESALEFGQQLLLNTSSPRKVRVSNSSGSKVTLTALAVEGPGSSQFTLDKLALPLVLQPGQGQDVGVTFTPLDAVDVNCTLKITFSDLPLPLEVALHGKGIPAVLSIRPSPMDFGGLRAGGIRREQPLTLTNLSSEPIVLAAPEVTYNTGEPFFYDGASLQGRSIEPGMSIIVTVGYQPMVETLAETILSFGTTRPQKPRAVDVQIKGRAVTRLLSVDQESLDFGFVSVNKAVEPKVITITNKSAQQQRVVVKLRDVEGSPFTLGTKALADAIPPGGTATFTVAFDPEKAGAVENEVQVWLQGDTVAEVLILVKGQGTEIKAVQPSGCSSTSTQAGSAAMLALLALVGLGSRRRRRG